MKKLEEMTYKELQGYAKRLEEDLGVDINRGAKKMLLLAEIRHVLGEVEAGAPSVVEMSQDGRRIVENEWTYVLQKPQYIEGVGNVREGCAPVWLPIGQHPGPGFRKTAVKYIDGTIEKR